MNDTLIATDPDQDILEVVASIQELGSSFVVSALVFFDDNCFFPADIRVDVIDTERIYIPNVISSELSTEGNNRWTMFTKGSVRVQEYSIYDRWGELVFIKELDPVADATRLTGPDQSATEWDLGWTGEWGTPGQAEGDAIQGVYVYVIKMILDEGTTEEREEIEAGDLTIFR